MNREETAEAIKVMQHYADGGTLEHRQVEDPGDWAPTGEPSWELRRLEYRPRKRFGECWAIVGEDGFILVLRQREPGAIRVKWEEV